MTELVGFRGKREKRKPFFLSGRGKDWTPDFRIGNIAMDSAPDTRPQRIAAIDALRGFDMFFLTGGLALVVAGINLFYEKSPAWLLKHAAHVQWEGFAAWDLVMPLFLFIVGTAMPFSFGRRIGSEPVWKIYFKVIKRVVALFLLGMVVQGNLLSFEPDKMSLYCNTLQAIGSGYLIAAICLLNLSIRWQVAATAILLAAYWLVMKFVPFSDPAVGSCAAGVLEPDRNVALLVDKYLMGSWQDGTNYAWILGQFGFGAMTMLGLLGGQMLKLVQGHGIKLLCLAAAGLGCLALGYFWSLDFPMIKKLFTSSMVLWAAGWCYLLLALFYVLTDVLRLNWLTFFFSVIGSNAIFVYMWTEVCPPTRNFSRVLFTGFSECFGDGRQFVFYLCNYGLIWSVLYYLYKNRTFIKV